MVLSAAGSGCCDDELPISRRGVPAVAGCARYDRGMTRVEEIFAGRTGRIEVDGSSFELSVVPLGEVRVPSGWLGAADPFVSLDDPLSTSVPPGTYPVYVTLADLSEELDGSHLREAYLSVRVQEGAATQVGPAYPEQVSAEEAGPDASFGIAVDAGTVAFFDAKAVTSAMPEGDWHDKVFACQGGWFDLMDDPDHVAVSAANVVMPLAQAGENVVLAHSGWGDGFYPVVKTYDAEGSLLEVHIDLRVLEGSDDD